MNDRCTPATARRLKEQGFVQPPPAPGQVWYKDEKPWLRMPGAYWVELINGFTNSNPQFTPDCYAPTAPDILRHLDSGTYLTRRALTATFEVYNDWRALEDGTPQYVHENPAEACAEAWEAKQKS